MTQDAWLIGHPYLRTVAEFHAQVEKAMSGVSRAFASIPNWHDYERDFQSGVPLLQSGSLTIDLKSVERTLRVLLRKLGSTSLPDRVAQEMQELQAELYRDHTLQRAIAAVLDHTDPLPLGHCGLLQYLSWTAMTSHLSRVVKAFKEWREEEHWLRKYCPTCGSPPAMAQLVGVDPSRLRFLSCGCCGTRWRYKRTCCAFCENNDDHRLAILVVEGESDLRIDYCESCGAYIKTYTGTACESVLLADWTSLHMDIIAQEQGLIRSAASLYEF